MADQKLPAISLGGLGGSSSAADAAHDPLLHPELYDGVALRRILAYFLDMVIIGAILFVPWMIATFVMVASLGLIVLPMALGSLIFIVLYDVLTIGGPASATPGMRAFGLKVISWPGGKPDNLQALLMSALFWAISSWSILPLAVALLNPRWRCPHDFLSGTVVVRRTAA
ncbi:MAG TPA: RDD family protein [Dongiaceae bacterium]|nr:RDD family protein [Dongiaceae bacterium]